MDTKFESALSFVLEDAPAGLGPALVIALNRDTEPQSGFHMLDPSVSGSGGAAFLWEDVLTIGDLVDAIRPLSGMYSPNELAALISKVLGAWIRLRRVRVDLTEHQMRVMRAVKRGRKTVADIALYTGMSEDEVGAVLGTLREKHYKESTPLLEGEDGALSTRF